MELISSADLRGKIVIDVCSGTGILGLYAGKILNASKIILIDIDPLAVMDSYLNAVGWSMVDKVAVLNCDLLSCIRDRYADVIIANPPYLPANDEVQFSDIESGPKGSEIAVEVVKQAQRVLKENGTLYMVFSSLSNPNEIYSALSRYGFVLAREMSRHYFFEDIIAIEAVLT